MPVPKVSWDGSPASELCGPQSNHEALRVLGFVGGDVHLVATPETLVKALFKSLETGRTDEPTTVDIMAGNQPIRLVPKETKAIDTPCTDPDVEFTFWPYPDRIFRGWVLTDAFDPEQGASQEPRFLLYIDYTDDGTPAYEGLLQIVPTDSTDPAGPLNVIEHF